MLMLLHRYFKGKGIRYALYAVNMSFFVFAFACFFILIGLIALTGCAPSHAFSDTDAVSENTLPKIQCIYIAPHLTDAGVLKKGHDVCWPNNASKALSSENSAMGLIEPYVPEEM